MIKINEKYVLTADRYNYTLCSKGVNQRTGEETLTVEGYVKDLQHAVELIYKIETRAWIKEHDADLKEAVKEFKAIWKEVQEWGESQVMQLCLKRKD